MYLTDIEGALEVPSTEEIEKVVYSHELEELLEKAIANMPLQRRQVFCMSRKQGLCAEEISEKLGISKRTVETHLFLALATLRKVIAAFVFFLS